jgi:hypothetical protein
MGTDEVGTLKGLTERRVILDGFIGDHTKGRIANTARDSLSPEFTSAIGSLADMVGLAAGSTRSRLTQTGLRLSSAVTCAPVGSAGHDERLLWLRFPGDQMLSSPIPRLLGSRKHHGHR